MPVTNRWSITSVSVGCCSCSLRYRKDIQAILKAGAKAKGMSTSEFKAEIQATIDNIINSSDIEEQKRFKQYFGNRIPTPEEYIYTITKKTTIKF